jgi:tetratricopeptide (TPR) repeat protein
MSPSRDEDGRSAEIIGVVPSPDERLDYSRQLYERAIFTGDSGALAEADRVLDAVEADLSLARGQVLHGRFLAQREDEPELARADPGELPLFERAAGLYQALGDVAGQAAALFWIGCFHQVAGRDDAAAVPVLERSLQLAGQAVDKATMAEALRHLGIAAHRSGQLDVAARHLEASIQLRRDTGALAGVASNQVGLIYIAIAEGRRDDALALADEALALAEAAGAGTIAAQVREARSQLPAGE